MARTIYANALLSDGKILFWYTGDKCSEDSFYKDFYYSGINELEYRKNHKLECKSIGFIDETENNDYNFLCFEVLAREFYKQWEISSDSKGRSPYL